MTSQEFAHSSRKVRNGRRADPVCGGIPNRSGTTKIKPKCFPDLINYHWLFERPFVRHDGQDGGRLRQTSRSSQKSPPTGHDSRSQLFAPAERKKRFYVRKAITPLI